MLDPNLFGEPEKLDYLMYFFPIITAVTIYLKFPIKINLTLLIVSTLAVISMESYHLAYKSVSSQKEKIKLVRDLKNIGIGISRNLGLVFRHPGFIILTIAWNIVYIWTAIKLIPLFKDEVFILIFVAQIALFLFSFLKVMFAKKLLSQ